jgi:hypothetical protein
VEWEDTKTEADAIRNKTLKLCMSIESSGNFKVRKDAVWVLYTMAEAYHYKADLGKQNVYEKLAIEMATANNDKFAKSAYEEQKSKIHEVMNALM